VLKHLPQLQKLDNVDVEPEELREAQDRGLDLIHPLDRTSVGSSYAPQYAAAPPQSYVQVCDQSDHVHLSTFPHFASRCARHAFYFSCFFSSSLF
jgi:hypothetical protein